MPAKPSGTVAQTGTVSSVDEENPLQIKRTRYPLCQTGPSLDTVYGVQAVCVSANLLLIPAKLNYRKAAIAERGLLAPRVKPGFRQPRDRKAKNQCGRFRRQQRIARCCAGSYRHVLILLVHIDGRTRPNVFPQIFSSFPQNSITERQSSAHRLVEIPPYVTLRRL